METRKQGDIVRWVSRDGVFEVDECLHLVLCSEDIPEREVFMHETSLIEIREEI